MAKGLRISKVYTRTGDAGETSLVGGRRVSKADLRVEAYGDVDELNSVIGLARVWLDDAEIDRTLGLIQNDLFTLGADLASPSDVQVPRIDESFVTSLEQLADQFLEQLEPLKEFILPGGGRVAATLHQARTICRRAERICVRLAREETLDAQLIKFLNRLSDALFVWARWVAKTQGEPEFLWERETDDEAK